MKRYILTKLFSRLFLSLIFLVLCFYIIFSQQIKKTSFILFESQCKDLISKISDICEKRIDKNEIIQLNEDLKIIDRYTNLRITLIDKNGIVIGDSRKNPQFMENHKDRPEFVESIEKGYAKSIRLSQTLREYMFYYAVYLKEKGVVLRLSSDLKSIPNLFLFIKKPFTILIFAFVTTLSFLYLLILWRVAKNIGFIEDFINNLAVKKDERKLLEFKFRSLTKLIENLNEISRSLTNKSELENIANWLYKIIDLIEIPTLILDLDGKIINYNLGFEKLIKRLNRDKYFWEEIENFELNDLIEKTIKFKEKFDKEVEINGKWYLSKTFYLEETHNILLFLFDITLTKEINKIRKDFIINVSHELKTPLTVIKGYIETIEERIKDEELRSFVNIINNQTDRMIKIVENIITLSQVELQKMELEDINIKEEIKAVYELYKKKAEEKNIQFILNLSDVRVIKGDKFKLGQVLINLVDNAIKFTDKGRVEINLKEDKKYIIIEIKDTGIGIFKEELPKIFEKFYVGEKKKPQSGTGLGLSIVKNIVELHNGKIEVESELNKGTKFTIYLPY
ncbi:MAG: ATP-binding protein [Candidatus Omnitrophica bacterium]|nr:ATP-binding protein [Candidatus Omnitrophota bacterium]MCM8801779.1 ATP-binding protein [Candidatus Omnitrophota bacterium]